MKANSFKLGLKLPTDPRWVNMAEIAIEEILTDHAYCEQKAASSCISLIQSYPDKVELVSELAPIVAEEWSHFILVYEEIKKRNFKLGRQRKDEYVNKLFLFHKKNISHEDKLLDKLLTCALIEARSCERFRLLSLHISDPTLQDFYYDFMVSEAMHYKTFLRLASLYFGKETSLSRWQEFLEYEKEVMKTLTPVGNRMH